MVTLVSKRKAVSDRVFSRVDVQAHEKTHKIMANRQLSSCFIWSSPHNWAATHGLHMETHPSLHFLYYNIEKIHRQLDEILEKMGITLDNIFRNDKIIQKMASKKRATVCAVQREGRMVGFPSEAAGAATSEPPGKTGTLSALRKTEISVDTDNQGGTA